MIQLRTRLLKFEGGGFSAHVIFRRDFHGISKQLQMFIKFWGCGKKPVQKPCPGPVAVTTDQEQVRAEKKRRREEKRGKRSVLRTEEGKREKVKRREEREKKERRDCKVSECAGGGGGAGKKPVQKPCPDPVAHPLAGGSVCGGRRRTLP